MPRDQEQPIRKWILKGAPALLVAGLILSCSSGPETREKLVERSSDAPTTQPASKTPVEPAGKPETRGTIGETLPEAKPGRIMGVLVKEPEFRQVDDHVLDRSNGIRWQLCEFGRRYEDGKCVGTPTKLKFDAAEAYCAELTLGGHDWRLPRSSELESLYVGVAGAEKSTRGPFPAPARDVYWSSTRLRERSYSIMVLDFALGMVYTYDKDHQGYARCVSRDGTSA